MRPRPFGVNGQTVTLFDWAHTVPKLQISLTVFAGLILRKVVQTGSSVTSTSGSRLPFSAVPHGPDLRRRLPAQPNPARISPVVQSDESALRTGAEMSEPPAGEQQRLAAHIAESENLADQHVVIAAGVAVGQAALEVRDAAG